MGYVVKHPRGKVAPRKAPLLVRPRRLVSRAADAVGRRMRSLRVRLAARNKVAPAQWWWTRWSLRRFLPYLAVPAVICWVGFGVWALVEGEKSPLEKGCAGSGNGCAVVYGFLGPFLSLGLATVVFFCVTYGSVRRTVIRAARKDPRGMVPTAGPAIRDVVGREEMCRVIARALRDKRTRRPYLLVGGVGTGKTSVIVQLTRMLAEKGAVPVPIRLRDVDMDAERLDFHEAAMKRFAEMADRKVLSERHSERVWRQLCMDDKAVVLADGLEETFAADDRQRERDVLIRRAIERAEQQKLPLVIASRPHAPLEHTRAAFVDLEPLSDEAALEYLQRDHRDRECDHLDRVVEMAGGSESPLYLQIARELREHPPRDKTADDRRWAGLNTRNGDRTASQRRLLDEWREALVTGRLYGKVALAPVEREKVVELVSALAGIGLLRDQLEVRIDDLGSEPDIMARLMQRLEGCCDKIDPQRQRELRALCATQGEQLGLVETRGEKIRFQHSILQAYLGSGYLDVKDHALLDVALGKEEGPGRELLIGLGLHSRSRHHDPQKPVVGRILEAAGRRNDAKALDMYVVALDIDRATGASDHQRIAGRLREQWADIVSGDRRTIEEAKERLVHRFGEVLRAVACPAYEQFFTIATVEPSYQIRLAVAQEMGAGGDKAFEALRSMFPLPRKDERGRYDPWAQYEEEIGQQSDAEHWDRENLVRRTGVPQDVYGKKDKEITEKGEEQRLRIWRKFVMRAWLVPMTVGSVSRKHREQAMERLRLWLHHLEPEHSRPHGADLPLSLETALAQGFLSAANRRRAHPQTNEEAREFLVAQAEAMLADARYWYSQMTLIQALCLWELPDRTGRAPHGGSGSGRPASKADPTKAVRRWLALAGSKQDPRALHPGDRTRKGDRVHPFVSAAASLAVLALESGRPERFVWIDEIGIMNKIGSFTADPGDHREHRLWIPPSVGWSTLHPRAQQLLADVFLLRNLTERDTRQPAELEGCLVRGDRTDLPPCLVKHRGALRPGRTVGMTGDAPPGSGCRAESACRDCPFELCPYPAMGVQPRAEVREVFCRQQQALLRRYRWRSYLNPLSWTRKRAPWQDMTDRELLTFWGDMADRSRTPSG
ncbi:ATP-binding protein [Streptomyces roseoverticillatus]|uniref:ATP-binding protein n=1 Tax=Streptomyces roseoverticillatus TaxID=66429 RepID=UPI001F25855E|nr:ATP-binding protein [Streptomyces roseoverticillatus]